MTDLLELHFLYLTKLHGVDENNPITWWMGEAKLIYERIPEIKEAKQMFEKVKIDPKYIELIRMREEANMEFNNALANARTEEREKAEREKQELAEKIEREKQELVKKLLHMGLSVEQISVATRLTIEEVKSL